MTKTGFFRDEPATEEILNSNPDDSTIHNRKERERITNDLWREQARDFWGNINALSDRIRFLENEHKLLREQFNELKSKKKNLGL